MIKWDYGEDRVMIRYDAKRTSMEKLAKEILALGYKVEIIVGASRTVEAWRAAVALSIRSSS